MGGEQDVNAIRQFAIEAARAAGTIAARHQAALGALTVDTKGRLDFVTRADIEVEGAITAAIRARFPQDRIIAEEGSNADGTTGRCWIIDPIDGTHNFIRGMPNWAISIGVVEDGKPVAGVIHAPATGMTLSAARGAGAWHNEAPLPPRRDLPDGAANLVFVGISPSQPAAVHRWVPAYVREDLGMAERRLGSATSGLSAILLGHGDLYIGFGESIWDVAGGSVILEEAGYAHTLDWTARLGVGKLTYLCGQPELVSRTRDAIAAAVLPQA